MIYYKEHKVIIELISEDYDLLFKEIKELNKTMEKDGYIETEYLTFCGTILDNYKFRARIGFEKVEA